MHALATQASGQSSSGVILLLPLALLLSPWSCCRLCVFRAPNDVDVRGERERARCQLLSLARLLALPLAGK